jgi:hypothetical protein
MTNGTDRGPRDAIEGRMISLEPAVSPREGPTAISTPMKQDPLQGAAT